MTHPTDYFCHSSSESGVSLHVQESGDAGLSSNMDHQFNDKYSECTLPVADKGSFVIPIPKQERDIFECPKMSGKIWSQPSVFGRAACPKVESQPETAEERFSTPPIVAAGQKNNFVPQATSLALSENNPEEETDKVLPRTAAITEEQQDVEIAVEDSCIKDTKMDTGGNPERKKGPPVDYGEVRNRHHHRKRAAGKTFYLLCAVAFIVPVSEASAGGKCFTCVDKDRCPKLMTIYSNDDHCLYKGAVNQKFPECCGISPPTPNSCVVCRDRNNITIVCSEEVRRVEVEDSNGEHILNVSPGCAPQRTCSARIGLIVSSAVFLIVVAALGISCCCRRNRT
ncbi:uncharacterized protein LOC121610690 isoform X2 [Chelmon rostratus]|uniref:uncharacterized protein LOC121610690 isoform X2 n=1 Tax=Chelmon rostratus TaxID=109905 RepID=UPI001BED38E8|nr:uncharacterized protein LOC121610690 isoform X2 [Chelmon rostratus]